MRLTFACMGLVEGEGMEKEMATRLRVQAYGGFSTSAVPLKGISIARIPVSRDM